MSGVGELIGAGRARAVGTPAAPGPRRASGPRTHLDLLGGFTVTSAGRQVATPVMVQRLLALLALRGRCGRPRLAGVLWPDHPGARALGNLRTVLWRTQHLLPDVVVAEHDALRLDASVEVDVARLLEAAHAIMSSEPPPAGTTPGFAHVDLLPDWDDDWLVVDRERLRQLRLHVLEALAQQLAARGRYGMALDAALAALQADDLRESAHRAVILVHLAEGNRAEAATAYWRCREVLLRELGTEPSPATTALLGGAPRAMRP